VTQEDRLPTEIAIRTDAAPLIEISRVVRNTKHDVLVITTSKAEVVLQRAWKRIQRSNDWITPLALLISIGLTMLTTNFDKNFIFSGDVWQALFSLSLVGCGVWEVVTILALLKRDSRLNPQKVVELLMADGTPSSPAAALQKSAPFPTGSDEVAPPRTPGLEGSVTSNSAGSAAVARTVADRQPPPQPPISTAEGRTSSPASAVDGAGHRDQAPKFSPGDRIRHRNFGIGTVLPVGPGFPQLLDVKFDDPDVGTKRLRQDLAPLWPAGDAK
jgi:hypothetical protein